MNHFFLFLYAKFNQRKAILFLLLFILLFFSGYFASKITLEEDITKIAPTDTHIERLNKVSKNSNFLDKIVITVSASDSSADMEGIMEYADSLFASLKQLKPTLIKDIIFKVDDSLLYATYSIFNDNLPVFLQEKDYEIVEQLIESEKLDSSLEQNYKQLLSPISVVLKGNILNDPIGITPYALKHIQGLQSNDNFELNSGYVCTKDKKHLLFFIMPAERSSETIKNAQLLAALDSTINSISGKTKNKYYAEYFGGVVVALGNSDRVKKDVVLTVSITVFALLLLIGLFFKRAEMALLIFLPVAFGASFSLAILYLIQGQISAIALGVGSVVLGIAINYPLHFYTHFKHTNSVKETIKDLTFPLTIGSITTVGAFLSLLFIHSEALRDFGLFAAFSLVGAAVFTLVFFPHFMRHKKTDINLEKKKNWIEKIANYKLENNKILLFLITLLCITALFTSTKVSFETDLMKLNYVTEKTKKAEHNLNLISNESVHSVYLVSGGKTLDEALMRNEANIAQLEKLQNETGPVKYNSVSNLLISESEQQKRIRRWNKFWTEDKKEKLKANLIAKSAKYNFKETAFEGFYKQLHKEYKPIGISSFSGIRASLLDNYILEIPKDTLVLTAVKTTEENESKLYNAFIGNPNTIVFNKKNFVSHIIDIIRNNFTLLLTLSSFLVLLVLIISYGRMELALVTYLPMVCSWLIILGLMGLFGIKFNIINIILSTFIFGLGDDYSIFITDALSNEYKTGIKNLGSYKTSIYLSASSTIIGIGSLAFAQHPALKSIGIIAIIGMFSVLLVANTIQPALFKFLITNRTNKKRVPFTFLNLIQSAIAFIYFGIGCVLLIVLGFIVLKLLPLPLKTRKWLFHNLRHFFNRSIIYINVHVSKKIINEDKEDFTRPALVICNHHSVIDSLLMQALHPKLILMVNDWVWNSPFMGPIVRLGGFIPKAAGYDENLVVVKKLISEGYSFVVFPEGSRSASAKLQRFHKGAFYIAEKLNLDIVPIIFHGTAYVQGKDDNFLLKKGRITVKYLPRILAADKTFGENYSERTKKISKYFKATYSQMRSEIETVDYYSDRLLQNYIYKGPVLEWYMRVKIKSEKNYKLFESILPKKGLITDIGCGYGFLPYMLNYMSEERIIIGMDYDDEKIAVANNCFQKNNNISFLAADALEAELPQSDAFVLSDILHYLKAQDQETLIIKCMVKLNKGGIILIRDGDSSLKRRHFGTLLTEYFATRFGFNKIQNKLEFVSSQFIIDIIQRNKFEVERIDNTKRTSNVIYVVKQQ